MYKTIRVLIAICLVMGIVLLAQDQVARANPSPNQSHSAENQEKQSILLAPGDEDCEKDKGKNKDKEKCKGTVKPPSRELIIPVTGQYSVGGFCTLTVDLKNLEITLDASVVTPLPGELPEDVQKIRQGCLLTYYNPDGRIDELTQELGNTTICFAVIPGKQMLLYFYDIYSTNPKWAPLETTDQDGIACGPGIASGVYVATFKKP